MDTPIIRTAAKSAAKINYRRLTELNSRYYGLYLLRKLTRGRKGVRNKEPNRWTYQMIFPERYTPVFRAFLLILSALFSYQPLIEPPVRSFS